MLVWFRSGRVRGERGQDVAGVQGISCACDWFLSAELRDTLADVLMRKQVGEVFDRNTLFLLNNDGKPQKRRILDSLLQPPTTVVPLCSSWKSHKRKLHTLFYNWKTKLCFHIYNNIDWASTKCSLDTANNIFLQQLNCWHSHIFAFSCMSLYTQSIQWWLISLKEIFKAYSCFISSKVCQVLITLLIIHICWSLCIIPLSTCSNIWPYNSY